MKHIILDTDLGGDPDDIFTLLMALNSPELQIDLIVTNDEHQGDRVRFTKKFLSMYGKEVPVVAGIDLGNERCFVVEDLIREYETDVDEDFLGRIKDVVKGNNLTYYVCIGAQSNLSAFIEKCPGLKDKVKILMMGGAINYRHKEKAEHNVRYDVEAAVKVFYSGWDKLYVLSDVTYKPEIRIDQDGKFLKRMASLEKPHIDFMLESMKTFFERLYRSSHMHDPLTLSCLLDESITTFETRNLKMDERGIMTLDDDGKETTVSTTADYEKFWKLFEERIMR